MGTCCQWHLLITINLTKKGRLGYKTDVDVLCPQLVPGSEEMNLEQIACGNMHTVGITKEGEIVTMGWNEQGQW
jgi:alpha-tubulin suppressor-like RCC1 family protein